MVTSFVSIYQSSSMTSSRKSRGDRHFPDMGQVAFPAFIGKLHVPTATYTYYTPLLQLGRARRERVWVGLYRRVGNPAIAAEVIQHLDADADQKRTHPALYLRCKESLRRKKARQARAKRIRSFMRRILLRPAASTPRATAPAPEPAPRRRGRPDARARAALEPTAHGRVGRGAARWRAAHRFALFRAASRRQCSSAS